MKMVFPAARVYLANASRPISLATCHFLVTSVQDESLTSTSEHGT